MRREVPARSWLIQALTRKPRMPVTIVLVSKIARIAWALLVEDGVYRTLLSRPHRLETGEQMESIVQQLGRRERENQRFPPCSKQAICD